MKDLIYEVNESKRTVTCTVENCQKDFLRISEKILSQYPLRLQYFYKFIATYHCNEMICDTYSSTAKCHPEDVFNEDYGRDLARTQVFIKREEAFQKTLMKIYEDINEMNEVNNMCFRPKSMSRYYENRITLLEEEKPLYNNNDLPIEFAESIDFKRERYTPHFCELCEDNIFNYWDDVKYDEIEDQWVVVVKADNGERIEMCSKCFEKYFG